MKLLSASILLARIRGVEIRFHFSMLFSLPIAYYLFRPNDARQTAFAFLWLIGFILCILLHELGHTFAARLFGIEVKSVVIWLLGGFTNLVRKTDKPWQNLVIYSAGPLANIVLTFLCFMGYFVSQINLIVTTETFERYTWGMLFSNLFFSLALVNFILVVFNLLPIYPLDGGNILHSIMSAFFGKTNADLITLIVGVPALLALFAFGAFTRDYLLMASCFLIALALGTLNRSSLHWINLGINYLFRRGGYYYLQGDYERAAQHYARQIEQTPNHPDYYLARAACLLNMGQKERARADVERALTITPDNPVALELRGELYTLDKNYDAALKFFDRAQEINPTWSVPRFDRGSVLLDKKEYRAALDELNAAFALPLQLPLYYIIRSMAHFRLGDIESAHADQDAALRLSEKDALVMVEVNMIIYDEYLDWAEDYYGRVIAGQPRLAYAWQGRADACLRNEKFDNAIADYARALELNPREARSLIGRGKAYQAKGEMNLAIEDFRRAASTTNKLHLKRMAEDLLRKCSE